MTSKVFDALYNNRDPKTVIENVIEAIRAAELAAPLPDALRRFFDEKGGIQRSWGTIRGEVGEIVARQDGDENKFIVTLSYEDYCRGCYMGTETLDLTIPDELVQAYENRERAWESEDWEADGLPSDALEAFDTLLAKYIAERVVGLQAEYEQATAAARRAAEEATRKAEAADRAKLAELQAKYG